MIAKASTLIQWRELEKLYEDGADFFVLRVKSEEEAEQLQSLLDHNRLFILIDDL